MNSGVLGEVAGVSASLCANPELIAGALLGQEGVQLWQDGHRVLLSTEGVCALESCCSTLGPHPDTAVLSLAVLFEMSP